MAVRCANCGEELLGAVNRCWKCGRHVLSTPDSARLPPVRRIPLSPLSTGEGPIDLNVADDPVVEDAVASSPVLGEPVASDDAAGDANIITADVLPEQSAGDPATTTEAETELTPAQRTNSFTRPVPPEVKAHGRLRGWLAIGSVSLGIVSLGLGAITPWVILFAAAGVGCGVLALPSRRRTTALVGTLLCLLGLTVSSVRLAYDVFVFIRGESPLPVESANEEYDNGTFDDYDTYDAEPVN